MPKTPMTPMASGSRRAIAASSAFRWFVAAPQRRGADSWRLHHDDEAGLLEMCGEPLSGDSRHDVAGGADAPAAAEQQRKGDRELEVVAAARRAVGPRSWREDNAGGRTKQERFADRSSDSGKPCTRPAGSSRSRCHRPRPGCDWARSCSGETCVTGSVTGSRNCRCGVVGLSVLL